MRFRPSLLLALGFVFAFAITPLRAEEEAKTLLEDAELGKWTQDFDAAKELAAEKEMPLFVNFTGSDWCYWCKLMDKNVFEKDAWKEYAKDKVVLVWIDFPRDETLVPEDYHARNQELAKQFQIRGFPTYLVFASDAETRLGKLGASREPSVESFTAKLDKVLDQQDKTAAE